MREHSCSHSLQCSIHMVTCNRLNHSIFTSSKFFKCSIKSNFNFSRNECMNSGSPVLSPIHRVLSPNFLKVSQQVNPLLRGTFFKLPDILLVFRTVIRSSNTCLQFECNILPLL